MTLEEGTINFTRLSPVKFQSSESLGKVRRFEGGRESMEISSVVDNAPDSLVLLVIDAVRHMQCSDRIINKQELHPSDQ